MSYKELISDLKKMETWFGGVLIWFVFAIPIGMYTEIQHVLALTIVNFIFSMCLSLGIMSLKDRTK